MSPHVPMLAGLVAFLHTDSTRQIALFVRAAKLMTEAAREARVAVSHEVFRRITVELATLRGGRHDNFVIETEKGLTNQFQVALRHTASAMSADGVTLVADGDRIIRSLLRHRLELRRCISQAVGLEAGVVFCNRDKHSFETHTPSMVATESLSIPLISNTLGMTRVDVFSGNYFVDNRVLRHLNIKVLSEAPWCAVHAAFAGAAVRVSRRLGLPVKVIEVSHLDYEGADGVEMRDWAEFVKQTDTRAEWLRRLEMAFVWPVTFAQFLNREDAWQEDPRDAAANEGPTTDSDAFRSNNHEGAAPLAALGDSGHLGCPRPAAGKENCERLAEPIRNDGGLYDANPRPDAPF